MSNSLFYLALLLTNLPSLNGDGRDDYIWVDPDTGDVHGWINRLEKDGVWQWQSLGRIAGGVGATNETLQMVDIDGKQPIAFTK